MAQPHEHRTYQLYQEYHQRVHSTQDVQTYMHFGAVSRTNAASQTELLTGYMKSMIESIIHDMNHFGDCWLLQAILGHEMPAIHVLDYSALNYVHTSVFTPEEKPRLNTRSIPYTSAFSASSGGLLYTDPKAPSYTIDIREERLLHHQCRALQLHAQKKALLACIDAFDSEKAALNSQIAGLKDRIFGLERELTEARAALHDTASAAFAAQRQQLLDDANAQAQQIIAQAGTAMAEVEAQQAAMQERLASHAQLLTAHAQEELRREFAVGVDASACMDVRSAMSEASIAMERNMTQQLEASAGTFQEARDAMLRETDNVQQALSAKLDSFLSVFEQLKGELAQCVSGAAEQAAQTQRDLAGAMDASAAAIEGTKGSMMQELQGWRTQLLQQDASRLTSLYASLHLYTHHKLAGEAAPLLASLDPEKDEAVIRLISGMEHKCHTLLVGLEAAMRDLGVVRFDPAEGEPFNDVIHRAVNEEALHADTSTNLVRECSVPGFRMASDESIVLRRAEVLIVDDTAPDA